MTNMNKLSLTRVLCCFALVALATLNASSAEAHSLPALAVIMMAAPMLFIICTVPGILVGAIAHDFVLKKWRSFSDAKKTLFWSLPFLICLPFAIATHLIVFAYAIFFYLGFWPTFSFLLRRSQQKLRDQGSLNANQ
jgi:hypothetical protein